MFKYDESSQLCLHRTVLDVTLYVAW